MLHLQQLKHAALTVRSILIFGMPASDLLVDFSLCIQVMAAAQLIHSAG